MFPMTVTLTNVAQLNAVMAALGADEPKTAEQAAKKSAAKAEQGKATVPTNGASSTPATSLDSSRPADAAAQNPAGSERANASGSAASETDVRDKTQMTAAEAPKALENSASQPAGAPTYQDAATAITGLAKAKGRDAAVGVLKTFGLDKLPDAKPEQFAAIIAAAQEAAK